MAVVYYIYRVEAMKRDRYCAYVNPGGSLAVGPRTGTGGRDITCVEGSHYRSLKQEPWTLWLPKLEP
jgi:hypothetical protein